MVIQHLKELITKKAFDSPCNEHEENFKTMAEISIEACDIIGNLTHKRTNHKIAFESSCNEHEENVKTMAEISKEACNIIGNPTLKRSKHKNIYLFF